MIVPSVGCVVWYHPNRGDPGPHPGDQPLAAIVTHVWNDRLVNLAVFSADGVPFPRTSVRLTQDDDAIELGQAQWMPFQVGQAAKHAAAEVPVSAQAAAIADVHDRRLDALESLVVDIKDHVSQLIANAEPADFSQQAEEVAEKADA